MAASVPPVTGSSGNKTPQRIHDGDIVYPLYTLDNAKFLRDYTIAWTLRFDDVLDADKLHDSLSRLVAIDGWRMFGGQLRLKDDGNSLEIHAPRTFTEARPAVDFSRQTFPMPIEQHPEAKRLPKATTHPSIHPGPRAFRAFAARRDAPVMNEDFFRSDRPLTSLHISSFTDATLVALSCPHAVVDLMCLHAIMHAWSLMLAGRDSEVPKVLGAHEDPMVAALADPSAPVEEFKLDSKRLTGAPLLQFAAQFQPDPSNKNPIETRTICLPKKFVQNLRQQAMSDLAAEYAEGGKAPFLSEADALTAWAVRSVALSIPPKAQGQGQAQARPITAFQAINMRFRLPSLSPSSTPKNTTSGGGGGARGVYLRNLSIAAYTFLPPSTATGPLGPIALANRRHLQAQSTIPQVLAYMRELMHNPAYGADPLLTFGEAEAVLVPFTNWTKADFAGVVDFGPAVLHHDGRGTGTSTGRTKSKAPGSLVYHHIQSLRPSAGGMNTFVILGRDQGGDYWVTATLDSLAWGVVRESLGIGSRGGWRKDFARL